MNSGINAVARVACAAALLFVGLSSSQASTLERIKQTGVVHIGYQESLPFSYKPAEGGTPPGYSIEVCSNLVEAIKNDAKLKSV